VLAESLEAAAGLSILGGGRVGTGPAAFDERLTLLRNVIALERVERVPAVFMALAFAPRWVGVPMSTYCADADAALEANLLAIERLPGLDGFNCFPGWFPRADLSGLWLSKIALPGDELPEDTLWQVQEAPVMTVDDYGTILEEGWPAFLAGYMPRIIAPEEVARAETWYEERLPAALGRARGRGYPSVAFGVTTTPFELLCGGRSMREFFADLYRRPDQVKAVMDVMLPHLIELGVGAGSANHLPCTWVGGWRSAGAFVGPSFWEEFVFPYLHAIVTALAEQGIVSVLHLDHDWTRDLSRLRELPARSCVLNPDGMTDIRRAKELLGDHMAIMGDVPATLFALGTPDDITTYVRDLVRDVGPNGLILCPGCDAPINTKPENMEAFAAACREFGGAAA
jgi:uroporphyrinogen-III decarboxylase